MIGDRWGVTAAEMARPYPCDELMPEPTLAAWRGVTVHAPADRVWPWIGQIRVAPYSYDWIDNLGARSPQTLSGLPDPVAGESFSTALRGRPFGRILSVTPGEQLTGEIVDALMSYVLVPDGADTRLLLKVVMRAAWPVAQFVAVGDLVMARRQLLNLARLAEGTGVASAH